MWVLSLQFVFLFFYFLYVCRQKAQIYSILFKIITLLVKTTLVVVVREPQPTQLKTDKDIGWNFDVAFVKCIAASTDGTQNCHMTNF